MNYRYSKVIIMCLGALTLRVGWSANANPSASELKDRAVKNNIVNSDTDTTQLLKRQEAAELYVAIARYHRGVTGINDIIKTPSNKCVFSDVISSNPNRPAITDSCTLGIFRGTEGKFLVDNNLTPSQAIVTLMRVIGGMQDENTQPWWKNYLDLALRHQIIPIQDTDLINSGASIDTNKILERIYAIDQSQTLKKDELVQDASVTMFGSGFGENDTNTVVQTGTDNISGTIITAPLSIKKSGKSCLGGPQYFMKCKRCYWALRLLALVILLGLLKRLLGRRPSSGIVGSHNERDDLTLIEGIGPRIQEFLYENGVVSFKQLARMRPEQVSELLKPYGGSFAHMYTELWPAQAALARDGKFDELAARRKELDNGVEPE